MKKSRISTLDVWMLGQRVGAWKNTPSRGHEFRYEQSWVESAEARPISLSLSLRPHEPYRGNLVANFFDNLLPDNRAIRERIRERFNAPSTRAFDLLAEIGRDCVGAVQLLPKDESPPPAGEIRSSPLDEAQVARVLRQATAGRTEADEDELRISLAGAQEKTALLRYKDQWHSPIGSTPTTHILKLPLGVAASGIDLTTSVENEWLCSRLLTALGFPIAACEIAQFEDQKTLIVERFDRQWVGSDTVLRIPQEDFAQVTGVSPEQKYESDGGPGIKQIMDYLLGSQDAERDRLVFMRMQLAFWLLCAIDGHAKNFSVFIEKQGRFKLTPAYDVISAYPVLGTSARKLSPFKVKMAMGVWGTNKHYRWSEIRRSHFIRAARDCGIGEGVAEALMLELVESVPAAVERVRGELPNAFPIDIADKIFDGLLKARDAMARGAAL